MKFFLSLVFHRGLIVHCILRIKDAQPLSLRKRLLLASLRQAVVKPDAALFSAAVTAFAAPDLPGSARLFDGRWISGDAEFHLSNGQCIFLNLGYPPLSGLVYFWEFN